MSSTPRSRFRLLLVALLVGAAGCVVNPVPTPGSAEEKNFGGRQQPTANSDTSAADTSLTGALQDAAGQAADGAAAPEDVTPVDGGADDGSGADLGSSAGDSLGPG